jgi:hypothetical protein
MPTLRRAVAVLTFPAVAYLGVACEREAPTGILRERGVTPAASLTPDDASTPVNYIGVNFAPIYSTTSYNYDWSTGTLTEGTATGSVFSTANTFEALVSDPSPPDPNGFGTFIGTARPTRFDGETVVYTQSVCPGWPAMSCLFDGSLTFGYIVLYNVRGKTLDQLTTLATMYNIQDGDCGGGSPRFSIIMSSGQEIFVYIGPPPNFTGCTKDSWETTGNFADDGAGLRWDTSQICAGSFYNTYSGAIACANIFGLTINSIFLGTDGGWSPTGGAPNGNQTVLFKSIQVNSVTRFPN